MRILLPVDGSEVSDRAVEHFVQNAGAYAERPEIHLLNVQAPLRGDVTTFVGGEQVRDFHRERGEVALASARERAMDQIVMGARARRFAGLLHGSVVARTLDLAPVPVLVVK